MAKKIINPWYSSTSFHGEHFTIWDGAKVVFSIGDFSIYKLGKEDFLHVYKGTAITELCGPNEELMTRLHNNEGHGDKSPLKYRYNSCKEIIDKYEEQS